MFKTNQCISKTPEKIYLFVPAQIYHFQPTIWHMERKPTLYTVAAHPLNGTPVPIPSLLHATSEQPQNRLCVCTFRQLLLNHLSISSVPLSPSVPFCSFCPVFAPNREAYNFFTTQNVRCETINDLLIGPALFGHDFDGFLSVSDRQVHFHGGFVLAYGFGPVSFLAYKGIIVSRIQKVL